MSYQLSRLGTTTGCSGKTRGAAAGKSGRHVVEIKWRGSDGEKAEI